MYIYIETWQDPVTETPDLSEFVQWRIALKEAATPHLFDSE
jgi:hypothetical protein